MTTRQELVERSQRVLLSLYRQSLFSRVLVRGDGVRVSDSDGRDYLDFGSGVGANVLGYRHPEWLRACSEQLDALVHASNFFYSVPQLELAEQLCHRTSYQKVFFASAGAEANEAAIKVARRIGASRGIALPEIICFSGAWHGRTLATISATDSEPMQRGFAPLLGGFRIVTPFSLAAIEQAISASTVAVMIEPILGHGGVHPAPDGFLSALSELCRERGILLIFDEIQSGMGRTGFLLAADEAGVRPDIITLGKGLGGGLPISATLLTDQCAAVMDVGSHGTTFGGNLLASRAATAVLNVVGEPAFLQGVRERGRYFKAKLAEFCQRFPKVGTEARGKGLLLALETRLDANTAIRRLADGGLIATPVGSSTIRFLPPLIVSNQDIDEAVQILQEVLTR